MIQPTLPSARRAPPRRRAIAGAILALAAMAAAPALAHPHVWVTARAELVFDQSGGIAAVRHIWQFDEAFSAYAVQGLDANNDGALTRAELAPLAQINVESLAEYGFFTWLTVRGEAAVFDPPTEYWLDFYDGLLTLFFTLPLRTPLASATGLAVLEVTDPEYFVAFAFADEEPIRLVDAPAHCWGYYQPPRELTAADAAALAAIPADQRALPPDLAMLTFDIANIIRVACP